MRQILVAPRPPQAAKLGALTSTEGRVLDDNFAMFERPPGTSPRRAWLAVGFWTLVIYVCIPFARSIQQPIRERWGSGAFTWITVAAGVIALSLGVREVHRMRQRATWRNYTWLGVVFLLAGLWIRELHGRQPEEALHFIEYSMLSLLLFRAWATQVRHPLVYLGSVLTASLIGLCDELVQWISPERYFDLRDIALNSGAAALVQLAIARGFAPRYLTGPLTRRGLGVVYAEGLALLLMLTGCLFNTPALQARYSARFAWLGKLTRHAHAMSEYGYLYRDELIGSFKSRLAPAELARIDRERGAEVAALLDASQDHKHYEEFLATYRPESHPFEYEARVHLFRRDQYRHSSTKYRDPDPPQYRRHLTIAYRENQILEIYFPNTLAASNYRLGHETLAHLREHLEEVEPYVSPVSEALIVRLRPSQIGVGAAAAAAVWSLACLALARRCPAQPRGGERGNTCQARQIADDR